MQFWKSQTTFQKLLVVAAVILGFAVISKYLRLKPGNLPTEKKINDALSDLKTAQVDFMEAQKKNKKDNQIYRDLLEEADKYYIIPTRGQKEYQKIINFDTSGGRFTPKLKKLGTYKHIKIADFGMSASNMEMRNIKNIMDDISNEDGKLFWYRCSLTPTYTKPRDTSQQGKIRFSGTVSGYILSPEASRFIKKLQGVAHNE